MIPALGICTALSLRAAPQVLSSEYAIPAMVIMALVAALIFGITLHYLGED